MCSVLIGTLVFMPFLWRKSYQFILTLSHPNPLSQSPSSPVSNSIFYLPLPPWKLGFSRGGVDLDICFMLPIVHVKVPESNTSGTASSRLLRKGHNFLQFFSVTRRYTTQNIQSKHSGPKLLILFSLFILRMLNSYILFLLSKYGVILFCFFIILVVMLHMFSR